MSTNTVTICNVERRRGDDYDHEIVVTDGNGKPLTLTTETFRLGISSTEEPTGAPDILDAAGTITDAANGEVAFTIPDSIALGDYFYDIEMTQVDSKKRTIMAGQWNLTQDISK